jgi:hypothetical protein
MHGFLVDRGAEFADVERVIDGDRADQHVGDLVRQRHERGR